MRRWTPSANDSRPPPSSCSTYAHLPSSPSHPTGPRSPSRCTRPWPTRARSSRAISMWWGPGSSDAAGRAHRWSLMRSDPRVVARRHPARLPVGPDHAGHHLPYTMAAAGGEPILAATLDGSCESVAWSSDGARLLVLAADPGSYGLDWSARAVTGAEPAPDPIVRRPGRCAAALVPDRPRRRRRDRGRSARPERVGGRLGRRRHHRRARVERSHGLGLVPGEGRPSRSRRRGPRRPCTSPRGRWRVSRSRRMPLASRSSRATRATTACCPGACGSSTSRPAARPIPGRTCKRSALASWADAGSLWYARTDGTGNACGRIWLDGRREERWRDEAFIGDADHHAGLRDHRRRRRHLDDAPGARRGTGAGEVRSHDGHLDAPDVVQRPHRRGPRLPRRPHRALDGGGRRRDRRGVDDAPGSRGARSRRSCVCTADRPGTGGRTSRTPNRTRCCSRRPATRVCSRTPAAASAEATPSRRR